MKNSVLLLLAVCTAPSLLAAPNVGVAVNVVQPGVYGRIDIGSYGPPPLVYPEPVIAAAPPVAVPRQPIYLYVPLGHQRNWRRYCGRYNACGQPVFFVEERWVRDRWEHEHDHRRGPRPRGEHEGRGRYEDGRHHMHGGDRER